MLAVYLTKSQWPGVLDAGVVGYFGKQKAVALVAAGDGEMYDPKNKRHAEAKGSPAQDEKRRPAIAAETERLQKAQRELHARQFGEKAATKK